MFKRMRNSHANIISLLATYEHCGHFHLIFPWAECDLQTYWKTINPDPTCDFATVWWMAWQCEGIAFVLDRIRRHEDASVSSLFADPIAMSQPTTPISPDPGRTTPQTRPPRLAFGRHGDIKPTNLLWFPNHRDSSDKGTIKISNLGTGEFNTTDSPSTLSSVPYSHPYRPPEYDLPDSEISNSSDIWTLGCLYLEFIVWFIGGWKLLEELEGLKKWAKHGLYRSNAFELIGDNSQDAQPQKARVKPAILEVRRPSL
jgi:serine/threonine protein kinase